MGQNITNHYVVRWPLLDIYRAILTCKGIVTGQFDAPDYHTITFVYEDALAGSKTWLVDKVRDEDKTEHSLYCI